MARERTGESPRLLPHESIPGLSIAELRQIIALMGSGDIQEISIERESGALRLHLRKPAPEAGVALDLEEDAMDIAALPADEASADGAADGMVSVTAPFVGRFHVGGKSGTRTLPKAGDKVRQGQVLGAIQTLNILSEVEATQAGRVAEVNIKDGQAVQYGQVLLVIAPDSA